jgi:hypothetical protein
MALVIYWKQEMQRRVYEALEEGNRAIALKD